MLWSIHSTDRRPKRVWLVLRFIVRVALREDRERGPAQRAPARAHEVRGRGAPYFVDPRDGGTFEGLGGIAFIRGRPAAAAAAKMRQERS